MPERDHKPDSPAARPASAEGLATAARVAARRGPAPVHLWNPPFCGDLDMRITRDGTWYYLGSPIGRKPLVTLFSSILKREGDDFFLVTPAEKVGITVEDAPFLAVDFTASGTGRDQRLTFTTHVGDSVEAGPDHPLRFVHDPRSNAPAPYVLVRAPGGGALEALIDRKSFYRLVELGTEHQGHFGVWSGGAFFAMMPLDELARLTADPDAD